MMRVLALLVGTAAPTVPPPTRACPVPLSDHASAPAQAPGVLGRARPHLPIDPAAAAHNREGSETYAVKDFRRAEASYRAALAKDPSYRAARLNLACALARQERFAAAAREAARIVSEELVPWSRQVHEATDLAVLHNRAELRIVDEARAAAAAAWGREAQAGMLLVAQVARPISPRGDGVFTLGPRQEIFSWRPDTGRFLQLTAEDGRVLAHAPSADGRRVLYVRAGKLVRDSAGPERLRDLSVRVLDLATMQTSAAADLPGDAVAVDLGFSAGGQPWIAVQAAPRGRKNVKSFFNFEVVHLPLRLHPRLRAVAGAPPRATARPLTRLTPAGVARHRVALHTRDVGPASCRFRAEDVTENGRPRVRIRPPRGPGFLLPSDYGVGLYGLPLSSTAQGPG